MHEQQEETSNGQETEFSPSRRAVLRAGWAAPVVLSITTPASVFANASPGPVETTNVETTGASGRSQHPVFIMPPGQSFGNSDDDGSGNKGHNGMGNKGKRKQ